jgi:ADP-ribosyl-[dinitrogen reductase] hydrolase
MTARPIEHCYWVVPGKFLAGEYPRNLDPHSSAEKIQALLASGVTAFIDLTREDDRLLPYSSMLKGAAYHNFPVGDVSIPDSPEVTVAILDAIDEHLREDRVTYLHCWGGIGRTGTIVGCWLVRHGLGGGAALARLRELFSHCPKAAYRRSPETEEQEQYILTWQEEPITRRERYRGCLFGLAAGDAVGTTVEFKPPGTFPPVQDMVGGGPFGLQPGEWTDDTSMALCLAESLVTCRGFDPADQLNRYLRWWEEGHLSSNGRCFDIGNTVSAALRRYRQNGDPFAGSTDPRSAGNGSLMRLAPVPLFYANAPEKAIHCSAESSKTTHGAPACVDACRYFGGLLVGALHGLSKEELLSRRFSPVPGLYDRSPLCLEIDAIACGSFKEKTPPAIVGSGYVVQSLEAALWAFYHGADFQEGCLLAVNLGDDADTTAAIYGQIAGAWHGVKAIPAGWRTRLARYELIDQLAGQLFEEGSQNG